MADALKPDPSYSSTLYTIWSVQDSLLQSYRSMFLTAESLLIGLAATIAATPDRQFVWPLFWLGIAVWGIWVTVTRARARDVRFVQDLLRNSEDGRFVLNPFSTFKAYQKSWLQCRSYSMEYVGYLPELFTPPSVWPPRDIPICKFWAWGTRIHMEVTIPLSYLIGWALVAYYALRA
jgi:hypothetical protein